MTVLRYIHQNPLKAGIVEDISSYQWSSYNEFISGSGIADAEEALELIDEDKGKALKMFEKFHKEMKEDQCLDIEKRNRLYDSEAIELIKKYAK